MPGSAHVKEEHRFPAPHRRWPGAQRDAILALMRMVLSALLVLAPLPLLAQTPLTAAEFEARVTGKTLTYSSGGEAYGVEEYFEGRRVRWSFLDGECQDGRWYVSGEQICFIYEDIPDPQCWQFYSTGGRLIARFENDPVQTELYETSRSSDPLVCLGPKIGV